MLTSHNQRFVNKTIRQKKFDVIYFYFLNKLCNVIEDKNFSLYQSILFQVDV